MILRLTHNWRKKFQIEIFLEVFLKILLELPGVVVCKKTFSTWLLSILRFFICSAWGLFTRYDCDCDLSIATNGLYVI